LGTPNIDLEIEKTRFVFKSVNDIFFLKKEKTKGIQQICFRKSENKDILLIYFLFFSFFPHQIDIIKSITMLFVFDIPFCLLKIFYLFLVFFKAIMYHEWINFRIHSFFISWLLFRHGSRILWRNGFRWFNWILSYISLFGVLHRCLELRTEERGDKWVEFGYFLSTHFL